MDKPSIIWQKWNDDIIDELDNIENKFNNNDLDDDESNNSDDDHDHSDQNNIAKQLIMIIPMGILLYNSANVCLKNFNLWVGHTNFSISLNIAKMIEYCDGVETLDVFTRYRFRIGVGKAFSDSVVMRNINQQLYDYIYGSHY